VLYRTDSRLGLVQGKSHNGKQAFFFKCAYSFLESQVSAVKSLFITNHLLNSLSKPQHKWFLSHSTTIHLEFGEVLYNADDEMKYVYFPLSGFISLLVDIVDAPSIEMGLVGNEGMLGATLALGNNHAPMQSIVQGSGSALKMDAEVFDQCLETNAPLRELIHSYLYVVSLQLAQMGACNCFHAIQQRLARWLLMSHDRAHSNQFYLTHEFLAKMLGVRRSSITIAASILQHQGLITYSRGQIKIMSREGLESASCSCYGAAIDVYNKNITRPSGQTKVNEPVNTIKIGKPLKQDRSKA
jgi:CRP-like cAMP-binding protein